MLKKKSTEHGTVQIKKPGRMRWDYTTPEKKMFVSDGRKIYSYIPADKQVDRQPPCRRRTRRRPPCCSSPARATWRATSRVTYADGAADGTLALRLDPKQKQRDYDWLILGVDAKTLQIRSLTAADQQGGRSTFQFSNYRENAGLAERCSTSRFRKAPMSSRR